jgi:chitin synthase
VQSILLRAQYLEYKVSHYLDKAAESLFGFVSVLPGAFSAFRYEAIEGEPLRKFLEGHKITDSKMEADKYPTLFESNKFLAEDRIMCLEILTKEGYNYLLRFIPGAKALTDPPMSLIQLLKQRRRWYNGTIVSTIYVLLSCKKLWRRNWTSCCKSNNSFCRNLFIMILYFYMFLNLVVSSFLIGIFYATFSIFVRATYDYSKDFSITHTANNLENAYLILMGVVLVLSVSVKIQYIEDMFRYVSFLFGIISIVMITSLPQLDDYSLYNIITVSFLAFIVLSYFVPFILNISTLKITDFVKGVIYSIFMAPTFINLITLYSICNLHDVSWGSRPSGKVTKGQSQREKNMEASYKNTRSYVLVFYFWINVGAGTVITQLSRRDNGSVLLAFAALPMLVVVLKLIFAILHKISLNFNFC